jgi:hypothetical protein
MTHPGESDTNWRTHHAEASACAINHELVEFVRQELADNLGVRGQALPEYGIAKVAQYAAQVARAQALGFDPDLLRMSDEECDAAMLRLAQEAVAAGQPVWVLGGRPDDDA